MDDEVETAWVEEIKRRIGEIDSGIARGAAAMAQAGHELPAQLGVIADRPHCGSTIVRMKVATGTVVKGRVVADGLNFADETNVYVVAQDERERVALSAEELAELEAGIAEADRGDLIPGDEFLDELKRFG